MMAAAIALGVPYSLDAGRIGVRIDGLGSAPAQTWRQVLLRGTPFPPTKAAA